MKDGGWSKKRWLIVILALFAIQVGFVFWRGDQTRASVRGNSRGIVWNVAGAAWNEILALEDPTLFILPHQNGFSGLAWMRAPALSSPAFFWTEDPCWLGLSVNDLGGSFNRFVATNSFGRLHPSALSEPSINIPDLPKRVILPSRSTLRIEGELATRSLLAKPELRAWPRSELLTNTVIEIFVDAEGRPVSPGVLLAGSGYSEADQDALNKVRSIRFNPIKENGSAGSIKSPNSGLLIFEWATVPQPRTNAPAATPPAKP